VRDHRRASFFRLFFGFEHSRHSAYTASSSSLPIDATRAPSGRALRALGALTAVTALNVAASLALSAAPASADSCASLYPSQPPRSALSAGLPDCRAYEQVNPLFKSGGNIGPKAISADGDVVAYDAAASFAGPSAGDRQVFYRAVRSASGWTSTTYFPSSALYYFGIDSGQPADVYDVTPDLARILTIAWDDPNHGRDDGGDPSYYIDTPDGVDGCATANGEACTVNTTPPGGLSPAEGLDSFGYLGASTDLSHLFFDSARLVPGDPTTRTTQLSHDLTEDYNAGTAAAPEYRYRLVGLENGAGPLALIGNCNTVLGSGSAGNGGDGALSAHSVYHAVSTDSSTVFFTTKACPHLDSNTMIKSERPAVDELFARVGGDGPTQTTVPISTSSVDSCRTEDATAEPVDPAACQPATFEGASVDGSLVYFTTTQADEVPGNSDASDNLYLAKLASGALWEKIQISAGDTSGEGARVQGVVRISEDGTHVYYVAQGVLATAPNSVGATAQSGAENLYAYDATSGQTEFVASLSPADSALWGQDNGRRAQSTPDGRYLTFDSDAQLTSDDTDSTADVYLYGFQTGTLLRVSHGRDGYDGDGNADLPATIDAPDFDSASHAGAAELITALGNARRAISDDGSTVFFSTAEPLQPDDVNGAPDVYEYHDGEVSLLSDGRNPDTEVSSPGLAGATSFAGASATGADAFFQTTGVLTPEGGDGAYDLFDARAGGGFPLPAPTPGCQGDTCQGAPTPGPNASAPGTASFTGSGNAIEAPLNKPKRRRKKHHKKKAGKPTKRAANTNRRTGK
jgi:hypothetical protein